MSGIVKLLIPASIVALYACTDCFAQRDPAPPLFGAQWDGGSNIIVPTRTPDGGVWTIYSDLALISAGAEHVRINQHDKLVTVTRAGTDAGWKCRPESR